MENGKYVALLYKYYAVKIGDLFVILHVHNKFLSNKKRENIVILMVTIFCVQTKVFGDIKFCCPIITPFES